MLKKKNRQAEFPKFPTVQINKAFVFTVQRKSEYTKNRGDIKQSLITSEFSICTYCNKT